MDFGMSFLFLSLGGMNYGQIMFAVSVFRNIKTADDFAHVQKGNVTFPDSKCVTLFPGFYARSHQG